MKPIISTLETIMINCIKEVFTHRIEDPDSLFNFYKIFFDKISILTFNFDLIMIMNWLGDSVLFSLGFEITTVIFSGVNLIFFILIWNFDFIDYNENNKYGFWKFVYLLLIYISIFIGIGSSSLLSQKIFIDLLNKYKKLFQNSRYKNTDFTKENTIISEGLSRTDTKTKDREILQKNKRFQSFLPISLITIVSFLTGLFLNLSITTEKDKLDEQIKNETYTKYNLNISEEVNVNITKIIYDKIYESDRDFFIVKYLSNYLHLILLSFLFYIILKYCFFMKETTEKKKSEKKKEKKEEKKEEKKVNLEEKNDNCKENFHDEILIENKNEKTNLIEDKEKNKENKSNDRKENTTSKNETKKDEPTDSYAIHKCCGYFCLSKTTNLKGDINCFFQILYFIRDFFVLNCKSLLDCCDQTLCHIFNIIFCGKEKNICKCNCECCGCNKIVYTK